MKKLVNLKDVKTLNKREQKNISGEGLSFCFCTYSEPLPNGFSGLRRTYTVIVMGNTCSQTGGTSTCV